MSYQPLSFSDEFLIQLSRRPLDLVSLYENLSLTNVERSCVDRLAMILHDLEREKINSPNVLDLGCSGGFFSMGLASTVASHVVGVDDDRYITIQGEDNLSSVNNTKKRIEQLGITNAIFHDQPIENYLLQGNAQEQFDVVLCLNILHHFYKGYGNLTLEGKLEENMYYRLITRLGEITNKVMYFETNESFFDNYDKALLEILHYGQFSTLSLLGGSPAADGELRIVWKFQK